MVEEDIEGKTGGSKWGKGDEHHLGREKSTADKEGEMEDNEQ